MSREKVEHYYNRQFLNLDKHHSIALIYAYLVTNEYQDGKPDVDGEIIIGDCGRQITLDFHCSYYDEDFDESVDNAIYKLDNMINCLSDFKKEYKKAAKKASLKIKKQKEKEKKEKD